MKAISSSITKIVALIAAMVVALGTFGLTTAHAADYNTSTITNPADTGTITITPVKDDTQERTFSGYRLAWLENVKTDSNGTGLGSFTVKTNSKYTTVIENVMDQITDTEKNATLLKGFQDDASYIGNPLGYIAATYGNVDEIKEPWGGDNADGSKDKVMRQFADKLAKKLTDKQGKATYPVDAQMKTGENKGVLQGLYLITETTNLTDSTTCAVTCAAVNSAPMIVSTTYTLTDSNSISTTINNGVGSIVLKATRPTITKQLTDDQGKAKTNPDFSIGDDVYYELTATIPSYTGYDIDTDNSDSTKARVLKIYDEAEPGLTIVSVESVYVDGTELHESTQLHEADYTATISAGSITTEGDYKGGTLTTIDLANYVNMREGTVSATNRAVASGGTVKVKIKAKLNSKAKVSDASQQTPNMNKTTLGYSHIPNDVTDEHKQPGGEVYVYTYKFKITKKNREGTPLPGAQFAIKNNADNQYLAWSGTAWTKRTDKPTAAAQALAAPTGQALKDSYDKGIFYSGADGTVSFDHGLKAGTYTIEEIASPSKYLNAWLPSFTVTIKPTYKQDTSTKPTDATSWGDYEINTDNKPLTISNGNDGNNLVTASDNNGGNVDVTNVTTITQLPKTGAAGIAFFSIIGVAIVAMAALFAVRARKAAKMA